MRYSAIGSLDVSKTFGYGDSEVPAVWSGYTVKFQLKGVDYTIATETGIRGTQNIHVLTTCGTATAYTPDRSI